MKPINIPINSPIDTSSEGLINSNPSFDKKNTLVYKGIASNITYDSGDGILSTTNKVLKIEGETLQAGEQAFTLPTEDYYTVENIGSKSISSKDCCINGVVAGSTNEYFYIDDEKRYWEEVTRSKSKQVWVAPIQNTNNFIFVQLTTHNLLNIIIGEDKYTSIISPIEMGAILTASKVGDYTLIGFDDDDVRKRQTLVVKDRSIISVLGFGCVSNKGWVTGEPVPVREVKYNYSKLVYGDGFTGWDNANYSIPVFTDDSRYKVLENGTISYWAGAFDPEQKSHSINKDKTYLELIADENSSLGPSPSTDTSQTGSSSFHWKIHSVVGMPINAEETELQEDNEGGYSTTNKEVEKTYSKSVENALNFASEFCDKVTDLTLVPDELKKAIPSEATNISYHKLKSGYEYVNLESPYYLSKIDWVATYKLVTPKLVQNGATFQYSNKIRKFSLGDINSKFVMTYKLTGEGVAIPAQTDGGRFLYGRGEPADRYAGFPWEERAKMTVNNWKFGFYFNGSNTGDFSKDFTGLNVNMCRMENRLGWNVGSYMPCRNYVQTITVLGDWTYGYNSMKAYKDLTDYDGVFPYLRIFCNIAGNRGKYFDWGPGWVKFYRYEFCWNHFNKSVQAMRFPLTIMTYAEGKNLDGFVQNNSLLNNEENLVTYTQAITSGNQYYSNLIEPLGNTLMGDWDYEANSYPWSLRNGLYTYDTYWKKDGKGGNLMTNTDWYYWSGETSSATINLRFVKKLEMIGAGKGIIEETFNFGGLGDDTILGTCSGTINITPDYTQSSTRIANFEKNVVNNDKLRLGIYQNINMALSYNGTLLFNATDLGYKFHIYKDGDDYIITIFTEGKAQWLTLKKEGDIKIDKLTDYLFRINLVGHENMLMENRDGVFNFIKGFSSFIGENSFYVGDLKLHLPSGDTSSNNTLLYADGINTNMIDVNNTVSFLMPNKTIPSYVSPVDMEYFETRILKNRHGFLKNKLRNSNVLEGIETYYTSLLTSADLSYKVTDKLPETDGDFVGNTGVQSYNKDMEGFTWWINSDTVIYPVAIGSKVTGINYQTSTIDLPGNYAVRFYTQNNKTWPVYNQNAQVYFGNNIFTIMGSNYYFDGQGVYYVGDSKYGGATGQYSENVLSAYAIGMKFLCNSPSEAYFYSPFDRTLYTFTSSNTMVKNMELSRYGDILDSCYCPVNQSLYILFEGKLLIKSQEDMAVIDVEGNSLQTTSIGVQVIKDNTYYTIHSPYIYSNTLDLCIETEWLGSPDVLSKYSYCDIILFGEGDRDISIDLQTIAGVNVSSNIRTIHINNKDWNNGFYRVRLTPKEPIGNAFKLILHSDRDNILGLYNCSIYSDNVSVKPAPTGSF